ncbi:MAG: 2-aminoethylphosphonate ABC transporter permease subunit [Mycobacteriaceae bacterium]
MTLVLDEVREVRPPPAAGPVRAARLTVLWALAPLAVLALFFVWPLVTVVRQSFQDRVGRSAGLTAWTSVLGSAEFRNALVRTIELALGSALGCVVLGTFFAIVLAFVPFPGSRAVARSTTVTLAFPSFFIALSFAMLYGSTGVLSSALHTLTGAHEALGGFIYTPWAVLLAEITFYTPFVVRPVLAACEHMQTEQLQVAASLGARPARVVRRVLLPELLPAIVSGGSLCLLLTLNEFGIVLFIGAKGVNTLPVLVYTKGIVSFDYPSAAVIACVQVALSLLLYAASRAAAGWLGGRRVGVV